MKLLYFAWVRTRIGVGEETLDPPASVADVAGLIDWLRTRSPGHAEALKDQSLVRVAVNQEFARLDRRIAAGDEIAIFPPVTGG